jgi:hypothetical protein
VQQDSAQVLALQALAWIAGDEDRLAGFMAQTGAGPAELRARAADPDFLGAVLDFLLTDDQFVIGFCDSQGLPYTAPQTARAALPGGASFHWT